MLTYIWAVFNTVFWWWTRCYLFPILSYEVLYVYLPTIWTIDGQVDEAKMYIIPYVMLSSLLLVVLMCLHWFWLSLFFKGFYIALSGGKMEDPIHTVEVEQKEPDTPSPTEVRKKKE
jgi:hypothetical protein